MPFFDQLLSRQIYFILNINSIKFTLYHGYTIYDSRLVLCFICPHIEGVFRRINYEKNRNLIILLE
jgi:hypothetical protein